MRSTVRKTSSKLPPESGLTLRGRHFSFQELRLIQRVVQKNFDSGRTRASKEICKALQWYQPNGWPKDRACREILLTLESMRYLQLPPRKTKAPAGKKPTSRTDFSDRLKKDPIESLDFGSIHLKQVKGTREEGFWNWVVSSLHYLGFVLFVGRSLKYLIYSKERVIGAIGWCDPAWNVAPRDALLVKLGVSVDEIRSKGICNGRFLILPWIKVPNLASYTLSLAAKQLQKDWQAYYSIAPLFLETFVDPNRYAGTCYKAANWVCLGMSKGYRKSGRTHNNSQDPKLLFIFPLEQSLRSKITSFIVGDRHGLP